MSFDNLLPTEEELKLQKELLQYIPLTGASIGNKDLMKKLSVGGKIWTDEMYWKIRNQLIDLGTLEKGRGRGGAVKRVQSQDNGTNASIPKIHTANPITISQTLYDKESDLYDPIAKVLSDRWVGDDMGFEKGSYVIEITAKGGFKNNWWEMD